MIHSISRSSAISRFEARFVTDYKVGRRSWRHDAAPARVASGYTYTREGIERLVDSAIAEFTAETGIRLPYNASNWGPWVNAPHHGWRDRPLTGEDPVETAARFAGFLKAAPAFKTVLRALSKSTSQRGIHSPRTSANWVAIATRWSPGAAERQLRAVMARANQILSPFGRRVSWAALATTLERGPKPTGKAALVAAQLTLGGFSASYKDAREWMVEHSRTVKDRPAVFDALRSWGHPVRTRMGIQIRKEVWDVRHQRRSGYLVISPLGEDCHIEQRELSRAAMWSDIMRHAASTWRRRAQFSQDLELPKGVSILVSRRDSYEAGNCHPGTDAWIRERGWADRWYVPAHWVMRHPSPRALAAVKAAVRAVRAHL